MQVDHLGHIDNYIEIYEKAAKTILTSLGENLETMAAYKALLIQRMLTCQPKTASQLSYSVNKVNEPFRTIVDNHGPLKFLALRRAFRNCSHVLPLEIDRKLFTLLSDTRSNVSYITLPYDRDPSAKFKRHLQLLRPLYIMNSLDMLAENSQNVAGDGIDISLALLSYLASTATSRTLQSISSQTVKLFSPQWIFREKVLS